MGTVDARKDGVRRRLTSSPNHCCCLHIADVALSSPAFANTSVGGWRF